MVETAADAEQPAAAVESDDVGEGEPTACTVCQTVHRAGGLCFGPRGDGCTALGLLSLRYYVGVDPADRFSTGWEEVTGATVTDHSARPELIMDHAEVAMQTLMVSGIPTCQHFQLIEGSGDPIVVEITYGGNGARMR